MTQKQKNTHSKEEEDILRAKWKREKQSIVIQHASGKSFLSTKSRALSCTLIRYPYTYRHTESV